MSIVETSLSAGGCGEADVGVSLEMGKICKYLELELELVGSGGSGIGTGLTKSGSNSKNMGYGTRRVPGQELGRIIQTFTASVFTKSRISFFSIAATSRLQSHPPSRSLRPPAPPLSAHRRLVSLSISISRTPSQNHSCSSSRFCGRLFLISIVLHTCLISHLEFSIVRRLFFLISILLSQLRRLHRTEFTVSPFSEIISNCFVSFGSLMKLVILILCLLIWFNFCCNLSLKFMLLRDKKDQFQFQPVPTKSSSSSKNLGFGMTSSSSRFQNQGSASSRKRDQVLGLPISRLAKHMRVSLLSIRQ
ncbi:hypothetical protein LXL04_032534 [Taraxacum kok-saghyz]